jgi:hypothetical protein
MRFESNGIFFIFIILMSRGSFITRALTPIAMCAQLEHDPRKYHGLAAFWFNQGGKGFYLLGFQVIARAFAKLQRAVFPPEFAGFLGHPAIGGEVLLWHRKDISIDVFHAGTSRSSQNSQHSTLNR